MIPLARVRAWQRRRQHLFTEFAFYAPMVRTVHLAEGTTRPLTVAQASANVLSLLGAPVAFAQGARGVEPMLVLSQSGQPIATLTSCVRVVIERSNQRKTVARFAFQLANRSP